MEVYVCEVRDNRDPSGTGRVKVRFINRENDEKNVKDEDLRWAHPVLPVTSISTGGIGHKPPAPPIGARLLCTFIVDDNGKEYPYYFGSIIRSEKDSAKGIQQQDRKTGSLKPESGSENPDAPNKVIST